MNELWCDDDDDVLVFNVPWRWKLFHAFLNIFFFLYYCYYFFFTIRSFDTMRNLPQTLANHFHNPYKSDTIHDVCDLDTMSYANHDTIACTPMPLHHLRSSSANKIDKSNITKITTTTTTTATTTTTTTTATPGDSTTVAIASNKPTRSALAGGGQYANRRMSTINNNIYSVPPAAAPGSSSATSSGALRALKRLEVGEYLARHRARLALSFISLIFLSLFLLVIYRRFGLAIFGSTLTLIVAPLAVALIYARRLKAQEREKERQRMLNRSQSVNRTTNANAAGARQPKTVQIFSTKIDMTEMADNIGTKNVDRRNSLTKSQKTIADETNGDESNNNNNNNDNNNRTCEVACERPKPKLQRKSTKQTITIQLPLPMMIDAERNDPSDRINFTRSAEIFQQQQLYHQLQQQYQINNGLALPLPIEFRRYAHSSESINRPIGGGPINTTNLVNEKLVNRFI